MKRLLVGAICAVVGASAIADEWHLVALSDTSAYLYDANSVQRDGKRIGAWVIVVLHPEHRSGDDYYLTWSEFDCQQKKTRDLDFYTKRPGVRISQARADAKWKRPIPGTMLDSLICSVCEKTSLDSFVAANTDDLAANIRKHLKNIVNWE